jgi:3'(2'), 5'-bisphosphate nucleotidase
LTVSSAISAAEAARLIDELCVIIARASTVIRRIAADGMAHRLKADQSPVTAADEASEATILEGLARLLPGVPVIAEEMAGQRAAPALDSCFVMVDPLDGTKEFIAGSDEFTVNLGIVSGGAPLAGVIASPNRGTLWRGIVGRGAERLRLLADGADQAQPIRTRPWPAQGAGGGVSRAPRGAAPPPVQPRRGPRPRAPSGSAVKFCQIAEGAADVYPRLSTVCEWDVAAGQALLPAAGGTVVTPQGTPLVYGRIAENFRVPALIAWGDPAKAAAVRP